ncbi:hypothetical protein MTR67_023432, partial [Solanum verrucosum]
ASGRGRVQLGRGSRTSGGGIASQKCKGRGTTRRLDCSGMVDFNVILGMDQLSPYHAILHCNAKTKTLAIPGVSRVGWRGASGSYPIKAISFIHAQRLVEIGCLSYLAFIRDTSIEPLLKDSILVVQEFPDVFPFYLPSVPSNRDIDFPNEYDLALSLFLFLPTL